ncbi:MAG: hypothetical protein K6A44_01110 [bacterium]|nr:hypothetical protein [bacterium]
MNNSPNVSKPEAQVPANVHNNAVSSVFQDTKFPPKTDVQKELSDVDKVAAVKPQDNSFFNILERIAKGSVNGIKNTFGFLFDCPPMAFASIAVILGVSVGSQAMFTMMLVSLGALILGAALSGITGEFGKSEKGN